VAGPQRAAAPPSSIALKAAIFMISPDARVPAQGPVYPAPTAQIWRKIRTFVAKCVPLTLWHAKYFPALAVSRNVHAWTQPTHMSWPVATLSLATAQAIQGRKRLCRLPWMAHVKWAMTTKR